MRGKTLIPAALFGVAIAALALAQTTSTPSTAPANGETAAPAPPNTQPTAAKPPETSPEAAQGSGGRQGNTQATAPEPGSNPTTATSAPSGAPKEGATGSRPSRKPVTEHPGLRNLPGGRSMTAMSVEHTLGSARRSLWTRMPPRIRAFVMPTPPYGDITLRTPRKPWSVPRPRC